MAQADNNVGVGMAPQYTATGSSIRQPSVNYQATVRLPDAPLENRVKEPKTDWVNYALSEAGRAVDAYSRLSASQSQAAAKIDKDAIKQAEAEEDRAWRNQLARESSRIAESVRQGTMTIEAADTAYRALGDRYITAGYDEEKVSKVIGRQDAGIRSLVQSKYSKSLTKELDRQVQQANTFRSQNPAYSNISNAKANSILQQIDNDMDNLARIQQVQSNYEPGSDEWYTYKALADSIVSNNNTMMVARHVGNLLMSEKGKDLTPENIQEITNRSLSWAVQNQISVPEAQAVISRVYQRMGVDTLKQNWIDTLKISTDSAKLATEDIMANAKLRVMSIPQVAFYKELGGESFEQAITSGLGRSSEFNLDMEGVTNEIINAARSNQTFLPSEATGAMLQGTNNVYANGSSTPFTRASTALTTLRLVNQNNTVTRETADGNVTIALNNLNGTSERLNLSAIRRDAKKLKESDQPDMQMLGEKTEAELDKLDANRIAAELLSPNSPMYQTVNGLLHSLNASKLRYDEDGKAFLSDTEGVLGSMSLALRGYGGEGSYNVQLKRLNESLQDLTPEIRKNVLNDLGIERAVRGEWSVLGSHDGNEQPRTIDVGEPGEELYTFSDGTVAKNALRPTQEMTSDPITTSIRMSNPSMDVGDDKEKLLAEKRDIINTLKGPEGSKDGLYDIIERLEKNGWKTDVFEQERDALEKRLKEIDIELNGGIQDEENTSVYGGKYDEYLNQYAEEYGQDARLIKRMLMKESSEDPTAVSGKGARGLMQLMPETFKQCVKELGLPDNADPHDPETNIRVGVYYFSKMMKQFDGDVNKALAAYNWGPGNVQRAVEEFGDEWWDGARLIGITVKGKKRKLPKETQKYVSDLGQMYA